MKTFNKTLSKIFLGISLVIVSLSFPFALAEIIPPIWLMGAIFLFIVSIFWWGFANNEDMLD